MKLRSFQHSTFNLVLLHCKFGDPVVQNSGQNVSLGPSRAYVTDFSLLYDTAIFIFMCYWYSF